MTFNVFRYCAHPHTTPLLAQKSASILSKPTNREKSLNFMKILDIGVDLWRGHGVPNYGGIFMLFERYLVQLRLKSWFKSVLCLTFACEYIISIMYFCPGDSRMTTADHVINFPLSFIVFNLFYLRNKFCVFLFVSMFNIMMS